MVKRRRLLMVPLLAFGLILGLSLGAWAQAVTFNDTGVEKVVTFSQDTPKGSHAVAVYIFTQEVKYNKDKNFYELPFVIQFLDRDGKVNIYEEGVCWGGTHNCGYDEDNSGGVYVVVSSKVGFVGANDFEKTYTLEMDEGVIKDEIFYMGTEGEDEIAVKVYYKQCGSDACEPAVLLAEVTIPISVERLSPQPQVAPLTEIQKFYVAGVEKEDAPDDLKLPRYYYNVRLSRTLQKVAAGSKFRVFVFGNRNAEGTAQVAFVRVVDDKGNVIPYPTATYTVDVDVKNGVGTKEVTLTKAGYYVVMAYVKGTSPVDTMKDACFYSGSPAGAATVNYIEEQFDISDLSGVFGGCAVECSDSNWCCLKEGDNNQVALLHVEGGSCLASGRVDFVVDYPVISNSTETFKDSVGPMSPNFCIIFYDQYGNVFRVGAPATYYVRTEDGKSLGTITVQPGQYMGCLWNGNNTASLDPTALAENEYHIYAESGAVKLPLELWSGRQTTLKVVDDAPYLTSCSDAAEGYPNSYVLFYDKENEQPVTNFSYDNPYKVTAGDSFFIFVGNGTGVPEDVTAHVYLYKYVNGVGCTPELVDEKNVRQGDWEDVEGGKVIKVQVTKAGNFCVAVQFEETKPMVGLCGVLHVNPSEVIGETSYVDLLGNAVDKLVCGNDECGRGCTLGENDGCDFNFYFSRFKLYDEYGNLVTSGSYNEPVSAVEVSIEDGLLEGGVTYETLNNPFGGSWEPLGYDVTSDNGDTYEEGELWYNGHRTVEVTSVGDSAKLSFLLNKAGTGEDDKAYVEVPIVCGSSPSGCLEKLDMSVFGPSSLYPYGWGSYLVSFSSQEPAGDECFNTCRVATNGLSAVTTQFGTGNFKIRFDGTWKVCSFIGENYNCYDVLEISATATGQTGTAEFWIECNEAGVWVPVTGKVQVPLKPYDFGTQPEPVPTKKDVGMYKGDISQAPVAYSDGKVSASFDYAGNVDVLVGVISCDFKTIWWLGSDCQFHEDFSQALSQGTSFSCSDVQLPADAGYVFWMVSGAPISQLDWGNGAYVLKIYGYGSCE